MRSLSDGAAVNPSERAGGAARRENVRRIAERSSMRAHHGHVTRAARPAAAAGLAAALLYLAAAAWMPPAPHARVLYDGLVPAPPYRWVRPPAGYRGDNEPPKPYSAVLTLRPSGSPPAEFTTDDLQATITLPDNAIELRAGETQVRVTLTPLDPAPLAPPPAGRRFDGNAYRIEAVYASSGAAAALHMPVTIVLRYAVHATTILRLDHAAGAAAWSRLPTTVFTGSQEDLAHSDTLGVFVTSTP
jgi:hypothetical protein